MPATHYEVLGVDETATAAEIKRAYHRQARLYHPDAHVDATGAVRDEAERTMQTLNLAWQVLRDSSRRRRYDRALHKARTAAAAEAAGGRGRRPARLRESDRRLSLGIGFQTWLGTAGMPTHTVDGRPVYNLRVFGTNDLSPLAALRPNRLVGLHAEATRVDDEQLRHLKGMTGLVMLDLTATPVTDVGLVHLLGCERLESLWLWDTAITDVGLGLVGRLTNLRQLGLGGTAVTDEGLQSLAGLHHLRVLQLWGTNVEGHGLAHLHGLPELESVSLPWRVRGRHRRQLRAALAPTAVVA